MATTVTSLAPSSEWKSRWAKFVSTNHPLWPSHVKPTADASVAGTAVYGDIGQWAVAAYAACGQASYAAAGYAKAMAALPSLTKSGDSVMQNFGNFCVLLDWLRPALTADQVAAYQAQLRIAASWCRNLKWRLPDADLSIGLFLGMQFASVVLGDPSILEGTFQAVGGGTLQWADIAAWVDGYFAVNCAGGVLDYSSEYNSNVLQIALLAPIFWPGLLPSLDSLLPTIALARAHEVSPDRKTAHCWGDCQFNEQKPAPFKSRLFRRLSADCMLLGAQPSSPSTQPLAQTTGALLDATYSQLSGGGEWRWLLSIDPATLVAPAPPPLTSLYAAGVGALHVRQPARAFHALAWPRRHIDHEYDWMGDYELVRLGLLVIAHPIGYGGVNTTPYAANTAAVCGLGSMDRRDVLAQGVTSTYAYLTCETSGPRYRQPYFKPPQDFLTSWRRTILWHFATETVCTLDTFNLARDPRTAADFARYRPADQDAMKAAHGLEEVILHMPAQPTLSAAGFSWTVPSGPKMNALVASSDPVSLEALDETQLWPNQHNYGPGELAWQVRAVSQSLQNQILMASRPQLAPVAALTASGFVVNGVTFTVAADGTVTSA